MDDIFEKLKANWEYCVAGGILLLAALLLGAYFLLGNEDDLTELSGSGSMETSSMLSREAMDFLTKGCPEVKGNPFKLPIAAPEPPKPKPKPKPQPPQPKPEPKPQPKPEPIEEVQPKKPEIEQAIAQFVMRGNVGARPMAIVKVTFADGKVDNLRMGIGDGAYGLKLLAIDGEQIEVQDAKGVKGPIPRGKARKLHLKR